MRCRLRIGLFLLYSISVFRQKLLCQLDRKTVRLIKIKCVRPGYAALVPEMLLDLDLALLQGSVKQLLLLVYDLENLFPVCYKVLICRCLVDVDLRQLPDETSLYADLSACADRPSQQSPRHISGITVGRLRPVVDQKRCRADMIQYDAKRPRIIRICSAAHLR